MKRNVLFLVCFLLASFSYATSTLDFSGKKYDVSVNVSDDSKNAGHLNSFVVNEGERIVLSLDEEQIGHLKIAVCDLEQKKMHVIVPSTDSRPELEFIAGPKTAELILGRKKYRLTSDWSM